MLRLCSNKKGIEQTLSAIGVLILALLVFIPLLQGGVNTKENIDNTARISACQTSILTADESKKSLIQGGKARSAPDCDRAKFTLSAEVIENNRVDEKALGDIIGPRLLDAWNAIGRDKYDPRSDWDLGKLGTDQENIAFCLVWDEIHFDKQLLRIIERNPSITLHFPIDYLCTTRPNPKSPDTYCDIFYGTSTLPGHIKAELSSREIDHGSTIIQRLYKPDLLDSQIVNLPNLLGIQCKSCKGVWSLDIVSSKIPYTQKRTLITSKGEILQDKSGNEIKTSICDRFLN